MSSPKSVDVRLCLAGVPRLPKSVVVRHRLIPTKSALRVTAYKMPIPYFFFRLLDSKRVEARLWQTTAVSKRPLLA